MGCIFKDSFELIGLYQGDVYITELASHYEFPGSFNRVQFGLLITLNSPETLIGQTLLI